MQWYLVRHGQSQNNAGVSSAHNVSLTELGQRQMACAADALAGQTFDALYCSPLERALQSAAILHARVKVSPYVHPFFSEVGFGWGEADRSRRELQIAYPQVHLDVTIGPDGWAPADQETEEQAYERAGNLVRWLKARHSRPEDRILIVSHGRFGSILIGRLVGVRPCGYSRFGQSNAGISMIEVRDDRVWLRFLNTTAHLPQDWIT